MKKYTFVKNAVAAMCATSLVLGAVPCVAFAAEAADVDAQADVAVLAAATTTADDEGTELTEGWNQCGTCEWAIQDGCLMIRPLGNSASGTLADWTGGYAPWILSGWRASSIKITGKVTAPTCAGMFAGCLSLKYVTADDLSGLVTSKVKDMSGMFENCVSLQEVDLTALKTTKVKDISDMFKGCTSLESVYLTGINTAKVTDMSGVFSGCTKIYAGQRETLVSELLAKNGGLCTNWASGLFAGCQDTSIVPLGLLDLSQATDVSKMFAGCSQLQTIDLTGIDTSSATNMQSMFSNCTSLTHIDVSPLQTAQAESMDCMFMGCSQLKTIYDDGSFTVPAVVEDSQSTGSSYMFLGCSSLVGGAGTAYSLSHTDGTYARLDMGSSSEEPGYFTTTTVPESQIEVTTSTSPVKCEALATLSCEVSGVAEGVTLGYQWQYRTSSRGSWKNCSNKTCTQADMKISTFSYRKNYDYRCVVTSSDGQIVASDPMRFQVSLNAAVSTKPVAENATATFTCRVTNNGSLTPKYQWQYSTDNGETWTNNTLATAKTYALKVAATPARVEGNYLYRCKVVVGAWTVYTDPIGFSISE